MLKAKSILLILGVLMSFQSFAQRDYSTKSKKAIKHFEEALKYYSARNNTVALEYLDKALKADENFVEAHAVSGDCYTDLGELDNAISSYKKVIEIDPEFTTAINKQLADVLFKTGNYEEAIPNYETFLTKKRVNPKLKEIASRYLENAKFGLEAKKNPVPFDPKNLGPNVNTEYHEYYPVLTVEDRTLVFTRNERRQNAMDFQEDFYASRKEGDDWIPAVNMGRPLNSDDNEGGGSITADGSQMFFVACNRRDGRGSCDIYFAQRKGGRWEKPANLGTPVNSRSWDSQPSISADGKTLFFASKREDGYGKADIYVSHLAPNGEWTVPRNLGPKINTPFFEESPMIHPDGKTLYFVSNGHLGMGERDIYMTRLGQDGEWRDPVNLGYPINTWNEEYALFVDAGGELAFFSSAREGGYGELDVYSFELYDDIKPNKVTYVKGRVKDKETGDPLGAKFELIDLETSKVVVESSSDKVNGKFLVTLPSGHDYALNVSKDKYLFYSEHFSIPEEQDIESAFTMDVKLQPIKFGEKVVLKNIFFETASYGLLPESKVELDKLVEFMKNNPSIRIEIGGHTDNVGKPEYNQLLSENRSKSVRTYLIDHEITSDRIQFRGYGEEQPIDTNETAEGRANNRRTEFKVLKDE